MATGTTLLTPLCLPCVTPVPEITLNLEVVESLPSFRARNRVVRSLRLLGGLFILRLEAYLIIIKD